MAHTQQCGLRAGEAAYLLPVWSAWK